jgi:hypothetical protein
MHNHCGSCYSPNALWGMTAKKGQKHTCVSCGRSYIVGEKLAGGSVYHIICTRAKITRNRNAALWSMGKSSGKVSVFVTCPNCLRIHEIANLDDIDSKGFVGGKKVVSCISCHCGRHFWPYLAGWKKSRRRP